MRMVLSGGRMMAGSCVLAILAAAAVATQPPAGDAPKPAAPVQPPAAEPKGVKEVRPNGLEIEDLKVGEGPECKPGWIVEVRHKGMLKADGKQFESTYGGDPMVVNVNKLIAGWREGIIGMKVGGKRRLVIPAALAFGEKGKKENGVPHNADLIYEIELFNLIQVEDLKLGEGAECKPGQTVKFFYRVSLKDTGKEVQSNFGKDPVEYPLARLIRGWQFGIPGMKAGGKRKLAVPWQYGYGEGGQPPNIPGRADLLFEIELVDVK